MSGANTVIHQNRLMKRFRDARAMSPETAATLADLGCGESLVFRRMVNSGVFVRLDDGRYYMHVDSAYQFVERRRQRMFGLVLVAIVLFLLWVVFR